VRTRVEGIDVIYWQEV